MAGYALYATEQGWVSSAEEIDTELNYLVIPRAVRRRTVTQKTSWITLEDSSSKSAGDMKTLLLDPAANVGRIEDFPMVDRPWACKRCNFRKLCFPKTGASDPAKAPATAGQNGPPAGAPDVSP